MPGKTSKIEHKIELEDEGPVCSRPYSLPYPLRQKLKSEIAKMLDMRVIRKLSSPYTSPVVIVKKRGSNQICVAFRKLNRLKISDPEPMKALKYFSRRWESQGFFKN